MYDRGWGYTVKCTGTWPTGVNCLTYMYQW